MSVKDSDVELLRRLSLRRSWYRTKVGNQLWRIADKLERLMRQPTPTVQICPDAAECAVTRNELTEAKQREAWWRELCGLYHSHDQGAWSDEDALRCYQLETWLGLDDAAKEKP